MEASKKPYKGCKAEEIAGGPPIPCGLSFKIDGIRGMAYNGGVMSSTGKPLPNEFIQSKFALLGEAIYGLDGECAVGNPWDKNLMQQSYSGVMSCGGEPEFTFWVFDDFSDLTLTFDARYKKYVERVDILNRMLADMGERQWLQAVTYDKCKDSAYYEAKRQDAFNLGYEGLYGKSWDGKYKHGRSGIAKPTCWKDKPWTDEEGEIIGFVEMEENQNEAFLDELGRTKRSTAKEGLVGKGILGAYIVKNPKYEKTFRVSCGSMTMEERRARWLNRESEMGKFITYKYFAFGMVDVPRSAIYKCHRDKMDMTDY